MVARGGSEAVLNTSVMRVTDQQPLAGYKVRYRVLDGPPAVFLPSRTAEYVATSDLSGNAPAALAQLGPASGVNRIGVEIIRAPLPTRPSDAGLELGHAETTVSWQAPVVTLDVTAPPTVVVGQELTYTIALNNAGQVESRAMTVRAGIPDGTQYVALRPAGRQSRTTAWSGRSASWTAGKPATSPPPSTPRRIGMVTSKVQVRNSGGAARREDATTDVTAEPRPGLKVGVEGPTVGAVGAPVTFKITVANPGTGPADRRGPQCQVRRRAGARIEAEPG